MVVASRKRPFRLHADQPTQATTDNDFWGLYSASFGEARSIVSAVDGDGGYQL